MHADKNSLVSATAEKSEWLAPKISTMSAQATENGTNPNAIEQNYNAGPNAGSATNNFGGS